MIEADLAALDYSWPSDLDRAALQRQTARAVYARLLSILPGEDWGLPAAQLHAQVTPQISPGLIAELVAQLRRGLCLGAFRAQSYAQEEDVLVPAEGAASAWEVGGSAGAELVQAGTPNEPYAQLKYDFSRGDTLTLSQTFHTTFPLSRLHRLQLSVRHDNTWHGLKLIVEKEGRRYEATRTLPLADYDWVLDTWQEKGPEDRPTKVKTWTLLAPVGQPESASSAKTSGSRSRSCAPADNVSWSPWSWACSTPRADESRSRAILPKAIKSWCRRYEWRIGSGTGRRDQGLR